MTTIPFDINCSSRPAASTRRRPTVRRWAGTLRRLTRPPRSFTTPTDRVLRDLPEARSLQR